jgi:cell division protease FtsH
MSSEDNTPQPPPKRGRKPNDEKDWNGILRPVLLWILIISIFPLALWFNKLYEGNEKDLSGTPFTHAIEQKQIKKLTLPKDDLNEVAHGELIDGTKFFVNLSYKLNQDLLSKLEKAGIDYKMAPQTSPWMAFLAPTLTFVIPILLLWYLFARQMRTMGRGALSFGKSRARLLNRDKNKITFKDVAGIEEAKDEVQEIVEFLKDPKKFQKLGGRIPKGVLMIGPPGTGKTLLAKAIAGEADVPFFSISGSDFVEMFVGVGASRVRDMFEQGRKSAPCLIFIDEIDAVGRSRFSGMGGGHDEREQTLNALLVEMDGFDTQEGIILIAATNRPDVLDTALLRPGRFDRQIVVDLPDLAGREQILKVHAQKVKLSEDADLTVLARGTPGFSGADLSNVLNEAALLAARNMKKGIGMAELEEARDKVRFGRERRSRVMDDKDKEITAYHEAGHAIVMASLEHTEPVHKVTIIPRGSAYLGATMQLPEKDRYTYGRKKVLDELTTYMGGRIAEEMMFGDITSGAHGDIKAATRLSRKMVCEWGMSEKLGFIEYGEQRDQPPSPHGPSHSREFSEATAVTIDQEVRRIIDECYERAFKILTDKKEKLIVLAKALLEYETLDGEHVKEILEHGKLLTPPSRPLPPPQSPSKPTIAPGAVEPRTAPEPVDGSSSGPIPSPA